MEKWKVRWSSLEIHWAFPPLFSVSLRPTWQQLFQILLWWSLTCYSASRIPHSPGTFNCHWRVIPKYFVGNLDLEINVNLMTNAVFPLPFSSRKVHLKFRYMSSVSQRNREQVLKALVVPLCTGTTMCRPQLHQKWGRMAVRSTLLPLQRVGSLWQLKTWTFCVCISLNCLLCGYHIVCMWHLALQPAHFWAALWAAGHRQPDLGQLLPEVSRLGALGGFFRKDCH